MHRLLLAAILLPFLFIQSCIGCGGDIPPASHSANLPSASHVPPAPQTTTGTEAHTVVKMTKEGGIYKVPVRINGTEMDFIFDTGASLISISNLEASYLVKQGKISRDDVEGSGRFVDAQGNVSEGTILNLKEVSIGGRRVYNVKASVVNNSEAPLLLGQTFLEQFGRISIDYNESTLTFY